MAARQLSLGRVIDWARNADVEEVDYVFHRMSDILKRRLTLLAQADQHNQTKMVKRAAKKNRDRKDEVQPPAAAASGPAGNILSEEFVNKAMIAS